MRNTTKLLGVSLAASLAALAAPALAQAPAAPPAHNMANMPPPRKFEDDDVWHIGKPDLIVEIPQPHVVPASGPDVWIDYIADSGLTEDRYVQAVETKLILADIGLAVGIVALAVGLYLHGKHVF